MVLPLHSRSMLLLTPLPEYKVLVESSNDSYYPDYIHSFLYGLGWLKLVDDLKIKHGQWLVLTHVVTEEFNMMLFEEDGGAITTIET